MNILKQTLMAAALGTVAMGAQATPFNIDLSGTGLGGGNTTGDKTEAAVAYQSSTAITLGANVALDVGDAIVTTGGLNVGSFADNQVTSFLPSSSSFGYSTDELGAAAGQWALSFDMTLTGTVAATDGTTVSEVAILAASLM